MDFNKVMVAVMTLDYLTEYFQKNPKAKISAKDFTLAWNLTKKRVNGFSKKNPKIGNEEVGYIG